MTPYSVLEDGARAGLEPARFEGGDFKSLCLPISPPGLYQIWRRRSESNRRPRSCSPLHDHSATPPAFGDAHISNLYRKTILF